MTLDSAAPKDETGAHGHDRPREQDTSPPCLEEVNRHRESSTDAGSPPRRRDREAAGQERQLALPGRTASGYLDLTNPYRQDAPPTQTGRVPPDPDWAGGGTDVGNGPGGEQDETPGRRHPDWDARVGEGWDMAEDASGAIYDTLIKTASGKTTRVEAHNGPDGKPSYFELQNDNGTRTLTQGEMRYKDKQGNIIVRNTKTGEITSQDADGDSVYIRRRDGSEIYLDKKHGIEYDKGRDGKYRIRDADGTVTEVTDKGAVERIGKMLTVVQRTTTIDGCHERPESGHLETFRDGQRYKTRDGSVVTARENGIREIQTRDGHFYRVDTKAHCVFERTADGKYHQLTPKEIAALKGRHHHGNDGVVEFHGVTLNFHGGKVSTRDGVSLGNVVNGKMVANAKDDHGKPVEVVNAPGKTGTDVSEVRYDGHLTRVDPNDQKHLVERFTADASGQYKLDFVFDSQDDELDTLNVQFGRDGTRLWDDFRVDEAGSIFDSSGDDLYEDSIESQQAAEAASTQSSQLAEGQIASVTAKEGVEPLTEGDVAQLAGSLDDINYALSLCLASNNFVGVGMALEARARVEAAIARAQNYINLNYQARSMNLTNDEIVRAGNFLAEGSFQAAAHEDALSGSPQTEAGKRRYLQEFGPAGLSEDDIKRLTS